MYIYDTLCWEIFCPSGVLSVRSSALAATKLHVRPSDRLERGQKQHLLNVHQYRLIQQRLNVLSETAGSNILKVDLDGLDQSKTKFPRNLQSSKTLASCWRPQLHLVGVIAWGVSGINYSCCFGVFYHHIHVGCW